MPLSVRKERKECKMNEKFVHHHEDCLRIKMEPEERENSGQSEMEHSLEFVCVKVEREGSDEDNGTVVEIKEEIGCEDALAGLEPVSFSANACIQVEVELVKQEPLQEDEKIASQQDFQSKPSRHSYNSCLEPICNIVESEENNKAKDCQNQKDEKNVTEKVPGKRGRKEKVRIRKPKDGPPRKRGRPRKELSERKKYACETCSKRFCQMKSLIIHIRTHTGERPFPCTDCGKNFVSSAQLASHRRVHATNDPLYCQICSKQFMHKCNLMRHHQVHNGEKRYACRFCEKSFLRSSNLKCHMRIHTEERPYACSVCEKLFKQRHDLTSHIRLHTGEKPFACKLCSKKFVDSSGLYKHKHVHIKHGQVYPQT